MNRAQGVEVTRRQRVEPAEDLPGPLDLATEVPLGAVHDVSVACWILRRAGCTFAPAARPISSIAGSVILSGSILRSGALISISTLVLLGATGSAQAVSKAERAQNSAIKKIGKTATSARKSSKSAVSSAGKARTAAATATAQAKKANDGVAAINANVVPPAL